MPGWSAGWPRRACTPTLCIWKTAVSYTHLTLLLDEPFTGMDPAAVQASIALLRERVEGRPVLLATHDRAAIDALGWPMLELQKLAQPDAACNSTNKGLQ